MTSRGALQEEKDPLSLLIDSGNVDITELSSNTDLENPSRFTKLSLGRQQSMHINALYGQIPQALASSSLANAYRVTFPEGLPQTLTALNQGGLSTMIRENGRFVGTASLYSLSAGATILGAFTIMSAVTGQYFLTQINQELKIINSKLDEILGFLYGEKRAELLSEIMFVQSVYKNFGSIYSHEQQKLATIVGVQEARKIAIKDIEFYVSKLKETPGNAPFASPRAKKQQQENAEHYNAEFRSFENINKTLNIARQLYVVSHVLEALLSQNYDESYLSEIKKELDESNSKCEFAVSHCLERIQSSIGQNPFANDLSSQIAKLLEQFSEGKKSAMATITEDTLNLLSPHEDSIIISKEGKIYIDKV